MLSIKTETFDKKVPLKCLELQGQKFCWGFAPDSATEIIVYSYLDFWYCNLQLYAYTFDEKAKSE